jgi:hypothetical protein
VSITEYVNLNEDNSKCIFFDNSTIYTFPSSPSGEISGLFRVSRIAMFPELHLMLNLSSAIMRDNPKAG